MIQRSNGIFYWLLLLIISYFSLFHKLDSAPFYMWDESWYALNAQEMLENGKYLEVYLLGKHDLVNSKPPFALLCMLPFIKLFGFNELGVRLASAIFASLSTVLLYIVGLRDVLAIPYVVLAYYTKKSLSNSFNNIIINHKDPNLNAGKYILTTKKERDVDVNNLFILETVTRKEDCAYYKIIAKR